MTIDENTGQVAAEITDHLQLSGRLGRNDGMKEP